MPFDGSNFRFIDHVAVLRAAKRKIVKPGLWAKGGDPDTWGEADCIAGWVSRIVAERGGDSELADEIIRTYLMPEVGDGRNLKAIAEIRLLRFNDRKTTTLADIAALFDRGIARAKEAARVAA
jgi:hypothetical protein